MSENDGSHGVGAAVQVPAIRICLFLWGIAATDHSFKLFGGAFSDAVLTATQSPVAAQFIGTLAISLVQSSSTISPVVVGMVAGGHATTFATGAILIDFNDPIHSDSTGGRIMSKKRKSAKTSQTQLVQSLTVDERAVRRWERGEMRPSRKSQEALRNWTMLRKE